MYENIVLDKKHEDSIADAGSEFCWNAVMMGC
jgi:hypothetical protein